MNATPLKSLASIIAMIFIALTTHASVVATLQPVASLSLRATNPSVCSLTISNSGDQVWIIQSSSNLVSWTLLGTWKIHNGLYHETFTNNATQSNLFYRAFYDPNGQDIFSTVTNALLLPLTLFDYAELVLPASFSTPVILAEDNMPATNATTDAGATLGRVLFYA